MGIEIVAGAIAAAGVTGTAFTIGTTAVAYSTVAAYAVVGGVVVGGSLALSETQKQHVNSQQTLKQALPPRQRVYGQALVGGSYFFYYANGPIAASGFILSEGPIKGIITHWIGDLPCFAQTPQGFGTCGIYPWFDYVFIGAQLGTVDQVANPVLTAAFPYWSDAHRNQGLANVVIQCTLPYDPEDNFHKFFPNGFPTYKAEIQGVLVFDPRKNGQSWDDRSTWAYSDNPALCILDYMTCGRGLAPPIPHALIDLPSFIAMANLCDSIVPNGTEIQYKLWGSYTLDEAPADVLARMLKTCDGEIYTTKGGKVGLRGGQWTEPTFTITPDMIIAIPNVQRGRDKLAKYNQLRVRYTEPNEDYQQLEGDPWDDVAAQQAAGGSIVPQDFDVVMVPRYSQALRLAKIQMAKDNPEWLLTLNCSHSAFDALGERTVYVDFPDLGINHQTFFVNGFDFVDDGATCKLALGSLSADAYVWRMPDGKKDGTGGGAKPPPGPYVPPTPTGLAATTQAQQLNSSASIAYIKVSVDPPSDKALSLVAQYRLQGATTAWLDMTADNTAYTALSAAVSEGQAYDVRVAFKTYGGTIGAYATATMTVASGIGPIARLLAAGVSMDFGRFTQGVSASDDLGRFTEPVTLAIDLGRFANG